MNKIINKNRLDKLAKQFLLFADPNRLGILCAIFCGEQKCVTDIAKQLKLSVATVSHHLQVMSKAGLVVSKRDGKQICYALSEDKFACDLKKMICKYK